MELGVVQKQWLADLRAYPERQISEQLGFCSEDGEIKACCLGQLLITARTVLDPSYQVSVGPLVDENSSQTYLEESYERFGLRGCNGEFKRISPLGGQLYGNLVDMNDKDELSWIDIADYIEQNPENVFTRSV